MSQSADSRPRHPRINPLVIWRLGFTVVLLAAGIWLVATGPLIAGAQGRTLGWVVIGYAILRLGLGYLSDLQRKKPKLRDRATTENPLD
jgi:hypothetical protein